MTASVAAAGPNRQNPPSKAARVKAAKPSPRSAKPTAKVKPAVKAIASEADDEPVAAVEPVRALPIPAAALLMQYQRVGRDLLLLSNERRAQIGVETEDAKLSCAELQETFRSIKINDA